MYLLKQRFLFFVFNILIAFASFGQTVKRGEYFFDNDPGVGLGTPITFGASDSLEVNRSISTSGLSVGFHTLHLRVFGNSFKRNSNVIYGAGKPTITGFSTTLGLSWSMYESRSFYIQPIAATSTILGIVSAEYFFDDDPGVGKGKALPAFARSDSLFNSNTISVGTLTSGFHSMHIRAKDQRGIWSMYESRSFYIKPVIASATVLGIVSAEYFIDNDPGVGKGKALSPFSLSDSVSLTNTIPLGTLTSGFHVLHVRTKDQRGIWSMYESRSFYVQQGSSNNSALGLVAAEYFFDNDPGVGKGLALSSFIKSDSVSLNNIISTGNMPLGFHTLHVRVKNERGVWGMYETKNFYIQKYVTTTTSDPIVYAEYFFNKNDPGNGKATPIVVSPSGDSVNVFALIPASIGGNPLPFGADTLNIRVRTASGKYSMIGSQAFQICQTAPQAKFSVDTVCLGINTQFTNLTTGFNAQTTFAWDFDNNGSINSTVAGSVSYKFPTAGTYTAKLTVSNQGACFTTATGQVLVVASVPAQPSGINGFVSVCKGVQTYTISPVNAVRYTWSTISLGTRQLNARKDTITVNWTTSGNDVLQVVPNNACGAGNAATLPVSINNTLTNASAGPDFFICQGDSVVLNASGGSSFLWLNQNITTTGMKVKPLTTTAYIVKVTQNNCSAFDTAFVIVSTTPPRPFISQKGDTLITNVANGGSYQWYLGSLKLGSNSNKFKPTFSGTYFVKVSVGNCSPPQSPDYNYVTTVTCIPQTITFNSIPSKLKTDPPFALLASVTSGLPISYSISGNAATILGNGLVSITGYGVGIVTASQAGNPTYCSAASVTQYFQVQQQGSTKQSQKINFTKINNVYVDHGPIPLEATATSGLPVSFTLLSGPASIVGGNIVLNSLPGFIAVRASQGGDNDFNPAPDSVQYITVNSYPQNPIKQPQKITFYGVADRQIDAAPIKLIGSATSGLKVDFIVTSGPAYVRNDTLFTTAIGKVMLKAYQHGNDLFLPADSILSSFTVTEVGCPFLPASPVVTTNTPLCTGDNLIVKSSFIPDGVYVWEGPDNFTATSQNFTILGVSDFNSGNYKVTVSVGNCKSVPVYTNLNIFITPDKPTLSIQAATLCQNNAVLSVPDVYGKYKWFLGTYTIANANEHTYIPGIKGSYYVKVYDSSGNCNNTSDIYIYNGSGANTAPKISALNNETTLQSTNALKYQWYLDKRLILGANKQEINVLYNGNYKVYVTYDDSCKLVSSIYSVKNEDLKNIERSGAVFTDSTVFWDSAKENYLTIIPNPAEGHFKVAYYSAQSQKVGCEVFNVNGSFIAAQALEYNGLVYSTTFITEGWKSGVFMVKIIDGTQVKWAKVVIY